MRVLVTTALLLLVTDDRTPVPGFFDLPVTGGTATYEMLGLRPEERGHAMALLTRQLFTQSAGAIERSVAVRNFVGQVLQPGKTQEVAADTRPLTIAAPLTADHWRDVLQLPDKADLFAAFINNRSAMLVAAGAMAADASTREFLERDRGLLRWIVKTAPAAFWISARSLKVEKDRVIVPGGTAAEPIWEGLTEVKVTRPGEFIRALLARDAGRLAWFYDAVGSTTAERRAAMLGAPPLPLQLEEMRALYGAFRSADSNWKLEEHPFLRGTTDPWIVASQIDVAAGGVAPPAEQWFWEPLFDRGEIGRRSAMDVARGPASKVTLAWLTQKISMSSAKERRDRFEMVRFAQGVFPNLDGERGTEALIALGGFRRYRAVLLTLDRMGVTEPRVYARAIEAARQIDDELSGRDEKHAVVAFQAALAILERARVTEGIAMPVAQQLVLSLADLVAPLEGTPPSRPFPLLKEWLLTTLLEALPPLVQPDQWTTAKTAYESRFLQALAGRPQMMAGADQSGPARRGALTFAWEGLDYRIDLFAAEHARIKRIREQIESPGLDAALAGGDPDKISNALLAMIYTPALGDPEGPALLGGDIAQRHNFGLVGPAGMRRDLMAWSLPKEQVGDGSPWHVEGSILGLDIALARLALRRIADNDMPVAPTINLNDQLTFARTVMTIKAGTLHDAHRDRIVAAIARGRAKVDAAKAVPAAMGALAAEAQMPPAVRQTLPWLMTRAPDAAPALFGLRDFFWLGTPDLEPATLDAWGIYAESLQSRLRTAMPPPSPWENFGGRADGGLLATQAPDLVLRMAEETARIKLPAQLIPSLLTFAALDYWHDVESRFADDWPAITRQALALSSSRVEDYVAALAGAGPLRPQY
jgi:hypothetical protein